LVYNGKKRGDMRDELNTNQKALECLENNEYEKAVFYFLQAVDESRDVKSLTNLAWIYSYEEDNDDAAIVLLEEVVNLSPLSYFPYSLLGEIYLKRSRWTEALSLLVKSINILPTLSANSNLGVVYYHLGDKKRASEFFLKGSTSSDYSKYGHFKCKIELDEIEEAKQMLGLVSEEDEEFFGQVEMAELYVEMECFELAIEWFKKGWNHYAKSEDWVSQYIYALLKLHSRDLAQDVYNEMLQSFNEDIENSKNEECNDHWSVVDKEEHIKGIMQDKEKFTAMIKRIESGYIPRIYFEPTIYTDCYLFGCKRHNHLE
jgi:tetratricopeptide (TPR) repeat protein